MGEEKLVLSIKETAKILGVSRGLAFQQARLGLLPTIRFGRRLLVPRAKLLAMLGETASTKEND